MNLPFEFPTNIIEKQIQVQDSDLENLICGFEKRILLLKKSYL